MATTIIIKPANQQNSVNNKNGLETKLAPTIQASFVITGSDSSARQHELGLLIGNISAGNLLEDKSEKKGINEVRGWQSFLHSTSGDRRALIIRNSEILTPEAQNAFLKTLEEPPENTIIILETENIHNLLPTVISRCQVLDTGISKKNLPPEEVLILNKYLDQLNGGVGEKFVLAQKLSAHRTDALEWVDRVMAYLHSKLIEDDGLGIKLKKLLATKTRLNSNVNVRLALENLFLNW